MNFKSKTSTFIQGYQQNSVRLVVLLHGLLFAGFVVIGVVQYLGQAQVGRSFLHRELTTRLRGIKSHLANVFFRIRRDAEYVVQADYLREYLISDGALSFQELETGLGVVQKMSSYYDQIRWIDSRGMERFRYDYINGQTVSVRQLRDRSQTRYFQEAMLNDRKDIYFLLRDFNAGDEYPANSDKLVFCVAKRLIFGGIDFGILVMNYAADDFFNSYVKSLENKYFSISILNRDSLWLYNERENLNWELMLPGEISFAMEYPEFWSEISRNREGFITAPNQIIGYSRVDMGDSAVSWNILVHSRPKAFAAQTRALIITNIQYDIPFFLSGLLLLNLTLAFLGQRRLARRNMDILNTVLNSQGVDIEKQIQNLSIVQDGLLSVGRLTFLNRIVMGISHELNTPVSNGVLALDTLEIFHKNVLADGEMSKLQLPLQTIRESFDRTLQFLSAFKRISPELTTYEYKEFDLDKVIDATLEYHLFRLHSNVDTKIVFDAQSRFKCKGYEYALVIILENLIDNAVHHSQVPQGDKLILFLKSRNVEEGVEFSFGNTGSNIDSAFFDTIFEPFYSTRKNRGHVGLGLYIVRHLVEDILQGNIYAENDDHCLWFRMQFPKYMPEVLSKMLEL